MDIYSHVMPALAREAADRMGAVLLGGDEIGGQPIATNPATRAIENDLVTGSGPFEMGGAEGV